MSRHPLVSLHETMHLYGLLRLPCSATTGEIGKRYLHLSRSTHPDKGGDAEEFKQIKEV